MRGNRIDEFLFRIDPGLNDLDTKPAIVGRGVPFYPHGEREGQSGKVVDEFFGRLDEVFGIFQTREQAVNQEIHKPIAERQRLRADKEYDKADQIRTQLLAKGVQLYDTKAGVEWRLIEQ